MAFKKTAEDVPALINHVLLTYYAYELKNVQVTSYQVGGNPESRPQEQMSLNFEEIKVTYTECDNAGKKKGNVEYTWKVEAGEK